MMSVRPTNDAEIHPRLMPRRLTGQRRSNFLVQGVKATEQNDSRHNSRRTSGTVSGTSPPPATAPHLREGRL